MCEVDNPHHAEYHRQPDTYEHQVGDAIDDLQRKSCKKIHCWIPCRLSTRDRFNRFQPPLTRFQNKTLTDWVVQPDHKPAGYLSAVVARKSG